MLKIPCLTFGILLAMTAAGDVVAQQVTAAAPEPPPIRNPSEVVRTLADRYPEALLDAGVGGTVQVSAFINAEGRADSVRVVHSSGIGPLDDAARAAIRTARFDPPSLDEDAAGAWFTVPVEAYPPADEGLPMPALREPETVHAALQAAYPRDLQRRRIHTTVVVMLELDDDGVVTHARAPHRGCFPSAPSAALEAVRGFSFERAAESRQRFPVTISFAGDTVRLRLPGHADAPLRPPARARDPAGPQDGATRPPEVRNTNVVQQQLVRRYPPHLRAAGIGGDVRLWLHVDERGRVDGLRVDGSSGHCDLDLAALHVGERMQFRPALDRGQPVPVWVEIPLMFRANR